MGTLLLIIAFLFIGGAIRGLIANETTHHQRKEIISAISLDARKRIIDGRDDYLTNYSHLDKVSYDEHFLKVFFFQDYRSLYPQEIQDLM